MKHYLACFLVFGAMFAACGGGDGPCNKHASCEVGTPCNSDAECASGLCRHVEFHLVCASACESQDDCTGGLKCGADTETPGVSFCQAPCNIGDRQHQLACIDGALTPCDKVEPGRECQECGCPDGKYCPNLDDEKAEAGICQAKRAKGETCYDGSYCSTNGCSRVVDGGNTTDDNEPGKCVAADAACDDSCSVCERFEPEQNTCIARCTEYYDSCPEGTVCSQRMAGGLCMPSCQILPDGSSDCPSNYHCVQDSPVSGGSCFPNEDF